MRREKAKKPYRSAPGNALWSFREIWKDVPQAFILMVIEVPLNVFLAYAEIYLPALAVEEITGQESFEHMAGRVAGVVLLMLGAEILLVFTGRLSQSYLLSYRFIKGAELSRKSMECFYEDYESKEVRDLAARAETATAMWNGVQPISDMPRRSLKLIENVAGYCLFGSVISFVSPWLVPFLTLAPLVNWFCARAYRRWEYANRHRWTDTEQKLSYVQSKTGEFIAAKDIRIYGMAGWLKETFQMLSGERERWSRKQYIRRFFSRIADLLVILLRDGAAYVMLIGMALKGEITVDKFVLYFSAISAFASFVGNIVEEWNGMHAASLSVCDFREYMDLAGEKGEEHTGIGSHLSRAPEIAFEHVSYRYKDAGQDTLRDVNFTIRPGEKVALVGLNGAGKTTLVKLMCGLYLPTSGEVKVNGVSAREFARRDYYKLFSPVFQDVVTLFFSLAEIVSGETIENTDPERAERCMRLAGLGEKIDALPQGIYTRLDKQVNRDGVELSGGELQKLMLARALYKDAPVLALDEPTAALDPIAENRIYLQYRQMARSKTALFISHRLASTRFCDRILYLEEGRIAEEGTHEELAALGGKYAELYEMQSCWYREDYQTEEITR